MSRAGHPTHHLLPPTKRKRSSHRQTGAANGPLAPVTANLKILDLLDIDEQQSTFDLYFKLDIKWFDVNVKYTFLHDLDDKNGFSETEWDKVHLFCETVSRK